jgi:hypothetical protein
VDFEPSRNLHKCENTHDNTVQWLDLKKKPVRNPLTSVAFGGRSSDDDNDDMSDV